MRDVTENTPALEIFNRIETLRYRMAAAHMDGALIVQKSDLFYFSGTIQQAHLYVPVTGEPLLMVRKSLDRAASESAIERIVPLKRPQDIPACLTDNGIRLPTRLGVEMDVLPANLYLAYDRIFDMASLSDISPTIRMIRAVKSDHEIDCIRKAARGSDQVAASVADLIATGMTELELAGKIEARARALGHQGIVRMRLFGSELFYGHLMSGPSGAVPSFLASPTGGKGVGPAVAQGPGFRKLAPHEPILVDYVFVYNGYLSDHTRIFSIGALDDRLLRAHEAMLAVQQTVKQTAKPGIRSGDVYAAARQCAADLGYADHFMGADDQRIRFVGHGIGLELDEYPFLAQGQDMTLMEKMTVAVEPKLVIPGIGVVGVENTHFVGKNGLVQLTQYPEAIEIVGG